MRDIYFILSKKQIFIAYCIEEVLTLVLFGFVTSQIMLDVGESSMQTSGAEKN